MTSTQKLLVGTYTEPSVPGPDGTPHRKGEGIHQVRIDAASAVLEENGPAAAARNASFLTFDPARRFLYCVNELNGADGPVSGRVSAYRIEPGGELTFLNSQASEGNDPCHLTLDRSGSFVVVANYSSGCVSVLPVTEDGGLGAATQVVKHTGASVHPARQTEPHPHGVTFDEAGRFLFVPDLGIDKVMIYAFNSERGTLSPNPNQPFVELAPGSGPRHIVMHPAGAFAYVINELSSTVAVFRCDAASGTLQPLQSISTLPEDFSGESTTAEIEVSPNGAFLYASNRGHDSLAIYAIDQVSGTLAHIGHQGTMGQTPRHFSLDPSGNWLVVANQDSDSLILFEVDANTGQLTMRGEPVDIGSPVCAQFL